MGCNLSRQPRAKPVSDLDPPSEKEKKGGLGAAIAVAGVVVTTFGGGFLVGTQSMQSENAALRVDSERLKKEVADQELISSMDTSTLIRRLDSLNASMGDKEELDRKLISASEAVTIVSKELRSAQDKNRSLASDNEIMQKRLAYLEGVLENKFESINLVSVKSKESSWLIPYKVGASLYMTSDDQAWLTITDAITRSAVAIGEKVRFAEPYANCSAVLVSIGRDDLYAETAKLQVICDK